MGYAPSLAEVTAEGSEGLLGAVVLGMRYVYLLMAGVVFAGASVAFRGGAAAAAGESAGRPSIEESAAASC